MIVKSLKRFGDITTGATYAEQVKIEEGKIFECDDQLAEERIKKGLVKKATKKEEKEYYDSIDTVDEDDLKPIDDKSKEGNTEDDGKTDNNDSDLSKNDDESTEIKSLEECTMEELIQIAEDENIELSYPKDDTAQDVIIETINRVRAERLGQSNGGENNEE